MATKNARIDVKQQIRSAAVSNCYGCTSWTSKGDAVMYCQKLQCEYKDPEMFDYVYQNMCRGRYRTF